MESKIDFIKKHFSLVIAFVCLSLFSFNFWLFYPGYITFDWGRVLSSLTLQTMIQKNKQDFEANLILTHYSYLRLKGKE